MDSTRTPSSQIALYQSITGARVLLGTIAATGALGLTSVIAFAPETETFLLLGALALPWLAVALMAGLPILIPAAMPQRLSNASPPAQQPQTATGTWRLAS